MSDDIQDAIQARILESLGETGLDAECPYCGKEVTLDVSNPACPECGRGIDIRFEPGDVLI